MGRRRRTPRSRTCQSVVGGTKHARPTALYRKAPVAVGRNPESGTISFKSLVDACEAPFLEDPDLLADRRDVVGPDPVDRLIAHAYATV